MISDSSHDPQVCQRFHEAIELIGRRWTGAIIYSLCQKSRRFSDFRAAIPDVSDRLLTERLKELEEHRLIIREVSTARPIQVLYHLTPKGRALQPILDALGLWAWTWSDQAGEGTPATCPEGPTEEGERPDVA